MSGPPSSSTAIVPVSADEIARRSYQQRFMIEDRVVLNFIEVINQGIRDQVNHGLCAYAFKVPSFIYGFPRFDETYVGDRLRKLYGDKGFAVHGRGPHVRIEWPASLPLSPTRASTSNPSSSSKPTRRRP